MPEIMQSLCDRYDTLIVNGGHYRNWSWTGGSTQYSLNPLTDFEVLRRQMTAETALALEVAERRNNAAALETARVRGADLRTWWLIDRYDNVRLAQRADGTPARRRYAATLAKRLPGQRMTQIAALVKMQQKERAALEHYQAVRELMHALLYASGTVVEWRYPASNDADPASGMQHLSQA